MKRQQLFNDNNNNRSLREIIAMQEYLKRDACFIRECLRHRISSLLMDTSESNPINIEVVIGDRNAVGMSSLQMSRVIKAFQLPSEGIIYFVLQDQKDPVEFDDPMFSINDLIDIAEDIEYEINRK